MPPSPSKSSKKKNQTFQIDHTPAPTCYDAHFGSIREAISELLNNSITVLILFFDSNFY